MAVLAQLRAFAATPVLSRVVFYGSIVGCFAGFAAFAACMPGHNPPAPLSSQASPQGNAGHDELAEELRKSVTHLAVEIGPRSTAAPEGLERAASWLESELTGAGYTVESERFTACSAGDERDSWPKHPVRIGGPPDAVPPEKQMPCSGKQVPVRNLVATRVGTDPTLPMVVVGGHYDAVSLMPGADDNASGAAATLALARKFAHASPKRTIRFLFWTNEEPPHFFTATMGSRVSATLAKERGDAIDVVLSLETLAFYSEKEGSQSAPGILKALYPSRGNFLAFVGSMSARPAVRDLVGRFRNTGRAPAEGAALPTLVPGVMWSDHESYDRLGYPAVMVTDTAFNRNANYHQVSDTPETLDFGAFGHVVAGLATVLEERTSQ